MIPTMDGKRSRMKYESFVVTLDGRKGEKRGCLPWLPGKQKPTKKCLSTTQRFLVVDLCSFRFRSDHPVSFFSLSFFFLSSSSSSLDFEAFKPWKRTNFPTFPGRIGEETSPRKKNNKREASGRSRSTDYGGSVKGKSAPIDIFFDKTGSDELFNVVIATVSRLRIVARLCAILRTPCMKRGKFSRAFLSPSLSLSLCLFSFVWSM